MNVAVAFARALSFSFIQKKSKLINTYKSTTFNIRYLPRLDACSPYLFTAEKRICFLGYIQMKMNQSRTKRASGRGKGRVKTKQDIADPELNVEALTTGPFGRPPEPGKGDLQVIVLVSLASISRITIPFP